MIVAKNKLLYLMYCIIVTTSFLQSVDISPYAVKFFSNKIFYISVVVCLVISIKSQKITISRNIQFPTKLLIAFAFFYAIANFYHHEPGWLEISIGNGVFYFLTFLVFHVASREIPFEKLLAPFLIIVTLLILLSLAMMAGLPLEYYSTDDNVNDYYLASKSSLSLAVLSGVYYNQNAFVVLAFMGSCIYLIKYQLLKQSPKKIIKYYYVVMLVIALVCALMTLSRAGLLACAILFFLYLLKILKNKNILFYLFSFGILLLIIIYFFDGYFDLLIYRVENDGTSNRMDIWVDAFNAFKENYIFGVGDYKYYTPNGYLTSHNIYIQLLASQGVFAFLFWTLFLFYFIFFAIKNIILLKININPAIVICSIGFLAIVVHQLFETIIIGSWGPLVLFMFLLMNVTAAIGFNAEFSAVKL